MAPLLSLMSESQILTASCQGLVLPMKNLQEDEADKWHPSINKHFVIPSGGPFIPLLPHQMDGTSPPPNYSNTWQPHD